MTTVNALALEQQIRERAVELLDDLADIFVFRARENASKRTGEMADSVEHDEPRATSTGATCTARATAEHARYQEEGTGIFGPHGVPIRPIHSSVLVFDWPAAGGVVFARSVMGSEPTRWWSRTREDWPLIVAGL